MNDELQRYKDWVNDLQSCLIALSIKKENQELKERIAALLAYKPA